MEDEEQTPEAIEREKKSQEKKIKIIIYVMIIALLGFGLFIFLNQKLIPGTYKYVHDKNTFDIQQIGTTEDGGITYRIKIFVNQDSSPKYINTRHEPAEMNGIKINPDVKQDILTKKEAYITINPNANLTGRTTIAVLEIDKFLDNTYLFRIPTKSAFTEKYEKSPDYTIKTCSDVTADTAIIWLRLGEETAIKDEKGCVIIEAQTEDELIKLADGLAFYLLGMIG
ncbi:MAG: hypothetical protein Q8O03_00210 [Nanoarchaeota archaeon]|nr:hypothetical protein [Nanoarchaeota archaeon]